MHASKYHHRLATDLRTIKPARRIEPIERPYSPHLKRSISSWEDEGPHLPTQCQISDKQDNALGRPCAGAWDGHLGSDRVVAQAGTGECFIIVVSLVQGPRPRGWGGVLLLWKSSFQFTKETGRTYESFIRFWNQSTEIQLLGHY